MTVSNAFIAHVTELLDGLGQIAVRRMFGGAALYSDGTVFALLIEDSLYLKTDEAGRAAFEAESLEPFSFETKTGRTQITSYYRAPERLLDDSDELKQWARRAIAVSCDKAAASAKKKARSKRASRKSR